MSGANVPYHLRPNKFVERHVFLELLERVGRWRSLRNYAYISMGGRFLEDFKVIHRHLKITRMVSLESDDTAYERQVFNRPLSSIKCLNKKSGDFIQTFDDFRSPYKDRSFIIWLDYASAKGRRDQLQEVESLTSKLAAGDVIKVTMNANLATLHSRPAENAEQDTESGKPGPFATLERKLDDYMPSGVKTDKDVSQKTLPKILSEAIKTAIQNGLVGAGNLSAIPLACCCYDDGHQMLTVTVLIVERVDRNAIIKKCGLEDHEFFSDRWDKVTEIRVPDLSVRERQFIDKHVFSETLEQAHARLPFLLDIDRERSRESLKQYFDHYRRYPNFVHAVF
ncbi:MAG: O-methyltransferase [Pirellulales bacterium]